MKFKAGSVVWVTPQVLAEGLKGHKFLVSIMAGDEPQVVQVTGLTNDQGVEVVVVDAKA